MARSRATHSPEWQESDQEVVYEEPRRSPRKRAAAPPEGLSRRRVLLAVVFLFFLVVFVAAVALAYQVDTFLATDSRFTLKAMERDGLLLTDGPVSISGAEHTKPKELLQVFQPDVGRSLYLLPLDVRRRELLAIDWVESATVSRIWPNRLHVEITERTPVAIASLAARGNNRQQMMLVDRNGVLMRLPAMASFDLPIVFGLSFDQEEEFRRARIELLQRLQSEVAALEARFAELDVSDPDNLRASLNMDGRNVTLLLGHEQYLPRVRTFLKQYENVIRVHPTANLFDMRLDGKIITSREGLSGA